MAIRKIRIYGDPILEKPCKAVTELNPRITELIDDMFETLYAADGVGLAAPQVGVLKNIFIVDTTGEDPKVFINPKILERRGECKDEEGCLSLPGKHGMVSRPESVTISAFDKNFEPFELECDGLLARAVCHELDHLAGKMFVDLVEGEIIENSEEYEQKRKLKRKKR